MKLRVTLAVGFVLTLVGAAGADEQSVQVVREVAGQRGGLYVANRAPLLPSAG